MIIERLTLCNFGIYPGEQSIELSHRDGSGAPITLIGGMNGYGKTSLLEAILLVLYGRRSPLFRDSDQSYSSYLRGLVHRRAANEEACYAELTLQIPDEAKHSRLVVRRSWNGAKSGRLERIEVYRDGVADEHLANHWDTFVEDLAPTGIASLFFFDGERISELAESNETTEVLRQAIRTLLGIETVDRLINDLGIIIRRNRPRLKDKKIRSELESLQREMSSAQALYDQSRQSLAALQNEIDRTNRRAEQLEEERIKLGGETVAGRARLRIRREELQESLAEIRVESTLLLSGAAPLLLLEQNLQRIHQSVQEEQAADQARLALPLITDLEKGITEELLRHSCDQRLIDRIRQYLTSQGARIADLAAQESVWSLSPAASGQLANLLGGMFGQLRNQATELLHHNAEMRRELDQIERHLQVEIDRFESTDDVSEKLSDIRAMQVELEKRKANLHQQADAHRAKREVVERKIAALGSRVADVEETERIVRYAARSQETMRVFRERLTEAKIRQLASEITDAFSRLTHKQSLVTGIQIDPNSLRIALLDNDGHEVPKSRLSSGERQMLAVALLWGLARASGQTIPVIIDTPMGRLDSSHRQSFVEEYLPNASHQVIVLSTDTEITGDYLSALKVHIGRSYHLVFEEASQGTRIDEGYFSLVGAN